MAVGMTEVKQEINKNIVSLSEGDAPSTKHGDRVEERVNSTASAKSTTTTAKYRIMLFT